MKIVFMGTPEFASASLKRLYDDGHEIACVLTQPDKPGNRGMKVKYSPVKEMVIEHGAPVYQPVTLKDAAAADVISETNCDLIVVVAYGKLLPKRILDIPLSGTVNIHASLLPKYRGAAPIQWAIINGETSTGVTSMYLAEELDAGDIIEQRETPIGKNETAGELRDRLSLIGAEVLSSTIGLIINGKAARIPQDPDEVSYAPPLSKNDSLINWSDPAAKIKNKIRGLNPWPVATADFNGKVYKVFSVEITQDKTSDKKPGEIVSAGENGLEIACADAVVTVKELQAPGGRRMSSAEYLRGNRI